MKAQTLIVLLSIALTGCRQAAETVARPKPKHIDPEVAKIRASVPKPDLKTGGYSKVSSASIDFGLKLLKQLVKENAGKNFAISPISLSQDFAMLHECTKGTIHDAVGKLLGVNGLGPNDLAYFHSRLLDSIDKDPLRPLSMANGLWLSAQYHADAKQAKRMEALFGCSVKPLMQDRDQAKKELNRWVVNNTDGMIKEIKTQLDGYTTAMFLNALLFDGQWQEPFDERNTKPRDFLGHSGTIQVPTLWSSKMEREAGKEGPYTGLKLPFRSRGYSFFVIMPEDKAAFDKLPNLLTSKWIDDLQMRMEEGEEEVSLPKLDLSSTRDLIPTLKAMGGGAVFDSGLDLSPLVPSGTPLPAQTRIATVFQQVKLQLSETGVKAAAMTEIEAIKEAKESAPTKVHIDRPFYYFITYGGTIVLCGVVVDPTKS